MTIKFCGAARAVTGSAHLLTLDNGYTILLDCGLYQGKEEDFKYFNRTWRFDPIKIDCVILSHAHIDHTGRLPQLVKDGFDGPIICTHATRDLCAIMLMDSAKIQERDAEYINKKAGRSKFGKQEALYLPKDVPICLSKMISFGYNRWYPVTPDVDVLFRDAGHILGSASITLRIKTADGTKTIGFTGDIGRPNRPILRDPIPMPECDFLICESTYGGRTHASKPKEEGKFLDIIQETCVQNKGKLIIPAFSIGRTQEIVHLLDVLENSGKLPRIPVYVDSPLAINATDIFQTHPECYDNDLLEYVLFDSNPFGFRNLHYIRSVKESKSLNTRRKACIIISASGMITAGRIKHHVANNIEKKRNTILMVGYCAPQTIGGQLRAGQKNIRIFNQKKQVNARVELMDSFSAHADEPEIIQFLAKQNRSKLQKIFLVHGNFERQQSFSKSLQEAGFKEVISPKLNQEFKLW